VAWLAGCLEAAARVLKPGGHLLVWSLPRTSGWTQWALEDAGLEVRDCIVHLFGQGFPKSLDVSKAIDRTAGRVGHSMAELKARLREAFDQSGKTRAAIDAECGFRAANYLTLPGDGKRPDPWVNVLPSLEKWQVMKSVLGCGDSLDGLFAEAEREVTGSGKSGAASIAYARETAGDYDVTGPATEDAARWEGFGTALKPGQEMWWLARKPLAAGSVAAGVLEWGTGALNIDGCRVAHLNGENPSAARRAGASPGRETGSWGNDRRSPETYAAERPGEAEGRWPANVVLTHDARCEPAGTRRVKGITGAGGTRKRPLDGDTRDGAALGMFQPGSEHSVRHYADADGLETVEVWACAPGCPVAELDRQSGVRPGFTSQRDLSSSSGTKDVYGENVSVRRAGDFREGYNDMGGASRFFPVFRYQAKAPASERPRLEDGTGHETVKPLELIRWLCRLITPPGGTVLDLFAGSGPVGEACVIEGFRCVLIDEDPKSAGLMRKRLGKPIQPVMFGLEA
jgi:hypothetical protein